MELEKVLKEEEELLDIKSKIIHAKEVNKEELIWIIKLKDFLAEKEKLYTKLNEEKAEDILFIIDSLKEAIEKKIEGERSKLGERLEAMQKKAGKRFLTEGGKIKAYEKLKEEAAEIRERYYTIGDKREALLAGLMENELEKKSREPLELRKIKSELWVIGDETKNYSPYVRSIFSKKITKDEASGLADFIKKADDYSRRCKNIYESYENKKEGKESLRLHYKLEEYKAVISKKISNRISFLSKEARKNSYRLSKSIYSPSGKKYKRILEECAEELSIWNTLDNEAEKTAKLAQSFLKNSEFIIKRCEIREEKIRKVLRFLHLAK